MYNMPEERTMKKTFLFLQGNQKNIYILQAFSIWNV